MENDSNLSRVVLVSGGSRGIGAAITRDLAIRGRRVACTYRSGREEADTLAAQTVGGEVVPVHFDLSDESTASQAVTSVMERWGRLDAVVLNAGQWSGGRLTEMSSGAWWEVVESNLRGTAALARAALPYLRVSPSPSIVIVSSVVGLIGHAGDTAYASAKAGLIGFARSLAKENARDGVRVNVVAPGFVETDMTDGVGESSRRRIEKETVLGRFGTVDEIASAAVFLCEDATFCTGTVLAVDGGWSI